MSERFEEIISLLRVREHEFSQNRYYGASEGPTYRLAVRDSPLLFVAPHAVVHDRDGRVKSEDRLTGPIAEFLAEEAGASSLVATRYSPGDGPWVNRSDEFKGAMERAVEQGANRIVDIHGMADSWGLDWNVGRGPQPSAAMTALARRIVMEFPELRIGVDRPFAARRDYTITHYVQTELSCDALQMELSRKFRSPHGRAECRKSSISLRRLARVLAL